MSGRKSRAEEESGAIVNTVEKIRRAVHQKTQHQQVNGNVCTDSDCSCHFRVKDSRPNREHELLARRQF